MIYGGAYGGGWTNFDPLNNPTYEFYPAKNINGYNGMWISCHFERVTDSVAIGLQIPAPFLEDCKLRFVTRVLFGS
jgi:hypothetical protein